MKIVGYKTPPRKPYKINRYKVFQLFGYKKKKKYCKNNFKQSQDTLIFNFFFELVNLTSDSKGKYICGWQTKQNKNMKNPEI